MSAATSARVSRGRVLGIDSSPQMIERARCLVQGGRGNAAEVVGVPESMIAGEPWSRFFAGFSFPYSFCGPEQDGTEGLAGWIRTTWLPHTECVPKAMRDAFVAEVEAEKT